MDNPILYTLVVHWEPSGCRIVASHPPGDFSVYRNIVIGTMKDLTTMEEDKISINREDFIVHLLIGELRYACLTHFHDSPLEASRIANRTHDFLGRVRSIYRELPILADLSRDLSNISTVDLSAPLKKIMIDVYENVQNLPTVRKDLDEVRTVLLDSVQKLIDRGQSLEDLVRKTQTLEIKVRKDFRLTSGFSEKKNRNICVTVFTTMVMLLSSTAFGILLYREIL